MMKPVALFPVLVLILIANVSLAAQPHDVTVQITHQPRQKIILGSIKGDKFMPIDTIQSVNNPAKFELPKSLSTSVYRIILGQTTYANVMHQPPQQLDFIVNNEDVVLKTDFNAPLDSLKVIQSEENKVWFEFLSKEKIYREKLRYAEIDLDYQEKLHHQPSGKSAQVPGPNNQLKDSKQSYEAAVTRYNQLQKEHAALINSIVQEHPNLFASRLIAMYREPFLDGHLAAAQRKKVFQDEYFKQLDFTDTTLINSPIYTQRAFHYLMSYAQKGLSRSTQEKEFMKAVDVILAHVSQNPKVYQLILDYLVRGFEKMGMEKVITYIADNYSSTCQTGEKTTLERRLALREMKIGTKVPNFSLNDINGDPAKLSTITKKRNLILFWASWCPHCNEMLPHLLSWYKQTHPNNFEVIAISIDTSKTAWQQKVYDLGMESWFNLSELKGWDGPVTEDYNVYATPTMFIIDKDRRIIAKPITLNELFEVVNSSESF